MAARGRATKVDFQQSVQVEKSFHFLLMAELVSNPDDQFKLALPIYSLMMRWSPSESPTLDLERSK